MEDLLALLTQFDLTAALDILLVAVIFYGILRLFAGTQGISLLRGVLVLALVGVLAGGFTGLTAFSWLIRNSSLAILVAVPVIFQPELRRALERLGRTGIIFSRTAQATTATSILINEIIVACVRLAQARWGAIIVFENRTGLQDAIESGVRLRSLVSADLLISIFTPGTPLHDGAVIVRSMGGASLIEAAACVLPLTQRHLPTPQVGAAALGTRHRAGIGITDASDALAVIVSEETGIISVARGGRLVRSLDEKRLRRVLEHFFEGRGKQKEMDGDGPAGSEQQP